MCLELLDTLITPYLKRGEEQVGIEPDDLDHLGRNERERVEDEQDGVMNAEERHQHEC